MSGEDVFSDELDEKSKELITYTVKSLLVKTLESIRRSNENEIELPLVVLRIPWDVEPDNFIKAFEDFVQFTPLIQACLTLTETSLLAISSNAFFGIAVFTLQSVEGEETAYKNLEEAITESKLKFAQMVN